MEIFNDEKQNWFNELKECQNHPRMKTCCFAFCSQMPNGVGAIIVTVIYVLKKFMMYFNVDKFMMFSIVLGIVKLH